MILRKKMLMIFVTIVLLVSMIGFLSYVISDQPNDEIFELDS